jgi:cobyrinic acid a,c-diamide synthase
MTCFYISAAHKSSGKTTLGIGLARALARRGRIVQTFKKGPDYIDPIWLAAASARPCYNLDFHLMGHEEIGAVFARRALGADTCLIEGNKGLYDGLDLDGANSNAALARLLGVPVVLVLDARGMTRGIAPLILGYQAFDPQIRIAGVILNRLGGSRHEAKLRAVIEHYTDVPVLGAVHEQPALAIVERHLGLIPANESDAARARIEDIAGAVSAQVDVGRVIEAGESAPIRFAVQEPVAARRASVRIALARDRAFGFYYADDLEALSAAGARLVPFDTLADERLPPADGLFIGGGFPECFAAELEGNTGLRASIRRAIADGMPAYAECGGLMYLARSLTWKGERREMVGAIPADVVMHERPVGRGYVRLAETGAVPWPGPAPSGEIAAHEFHYSNLIDLPPDTRFAYRVLRGHGTDGSRDGIVVGNLLASYTHLRSTACYNWAERFVGFVRTQANARGAVRRQAAVPG